VPSSGQAMLVSLLSYPNIQTIPIELEIGLPLYNEVVFYSVKIIEVVFQIQLLLL
jgi:hypothetical protein